MWINWSCPLFREQNRNAFQDKIVVFNPFLFFRQGNQVPQDGPNYFKQPEHFTFTNKFQPSRNFYPR